MKSAFAVAAALHAAFLFANGPVHAQVPQFEKCFGIAKASKNAFCRYLETASQI